MRRRIRGTGSRPTGRSGPTRSAAGPGARSPWCRGASGRAATSAAGSFRNISRPLRVQPGLQENDRGHLVDHLTAPGPPDVPLNQDPLRLDGREPLVPGQNRETGRPSDPLDERLGEARAPSPSTVHVQGQPDDDPADVVLADDGREAFEVPGPGGARESHERSGREAQLVAEGDADPPVAVIEGERAPRAAAPSGRGVVHGRKVYAAPGEVKEAAPRGPVSASSGLPSSG